MGLFVLPQMVLQGQVRRTRGSQKQSGKGEPVDQGKLEDSLGSTRNKNNKEYVLPSSQSYLFHIFIVEMCLNCGIAWRLFSTPLTLGPRGCFWFTGVGDQVSKTHLPTGSGARYTGLSWRTRVRGPQETGLTQWQQGCHPTS